MGMYSHTRPDGKRETLTDFPYYTPTPTGCRPVSAKHYQLDSPREAFARAQRFAEWLRERDPKSAVSVTDTGTNSVHVVQVE